MTKNARHATTARASSQVPAFVQCVLLKNNCAAPMIERSMAASLRSGFGLVDMSLPPPRGTRRDDGGSPAPLVRPYAVATAAIASRRIIESVDRFFENVARGRALQPPLNKLPRGVLVCRRSVRPHNWTNRNEESLDEYSTHSTRSVRRCKLR